MKHRVPSALAIAVTACAVLVAGAAAEHGSAAGVARGRSRLYSFGGVLSTAAGSNATTLSVQVDTGNRPALRALIGAGPNQVFAVDLNTKVLIGSHGVPHVGSTADLQAGDHVTVRIRTAAGSTLRQIESRPAATVADTAAPGGHGPLWLFIGTVGGPQPGGTIALHVQSGNWKALRVMLGQPLDQTFTYNDGTIFLLWQGGVPTVIDPSQLKAGDRISVRVRAPRGDSLARVEATPAARVGDHEPVPPPED